MGLISNGTTIFDNGAVSSSLTTSMVLVSSATVVGSSSSIIFTLSSYNIYKFFYVNVLIFSRNQNFNLIYQQIMGLIIMLQKQQHHGGLFIMRQEMILV